MARPLKPLIRGGGYYPSRKWTPLVYNGGYTTMDGGEPPTPVNWKTITGVSPLVLASALAEHIRSLTQIGKCTQASTPAPEAPVDIVCNNGALRMVDDELPAAYKRVLGFECDNNAMWEITGFHLKGSDTVRISFSVNAACNVFGCYQGADATDNYDLYISTSPNAKYFRYGGGTYLSAWSAADLGERFDVVYTPTGSQGMPQDSTWSPLTFTSANNLLIGATTLTGTSAKLKGNLYGDFIVDGRLKLIPCERVSDHTLGYYDTYTATFFTPYEGFDGAVSLGYDGSHYSLTVVGTPEVLTVAGNHASGGLTGYGTYVSPTTTAGNRSYKRIDVPNGAYQFSVDGDYEIIVQWRDPADPAVTAQSYENLTGWITSGEVTLDKPSGGYGITVRRTDGTSITPANIDGTLYCFKTSDIQTVTGLPMLLSVNDYKDEAEIISGGVKRDVGVTILTGEEAGWTLSTSGSTNRFRGTKPIDSYTPASRAPSVCTHFKYASAGSPVGGMFIGSSLYWYFIPEDQTIVTADGWKAWLKEQYAAGTPVIVVYPLAEDTTEQTTPHSLHTTEGDNVVSVVSNVDPVTLEVEYASSEEE